jgi:hypothetical protein
VCFAVALTRRAGYTLGRHIGVRGLYEQVPLDGDERSHLLLTATHSKNEGYGFCSNGLDSAAHQRGFKLCVLCILIFFFGGGGGSG